MVASALKRLVQDKRADDRPENPETALFRAFCEEWRGSALPEKAADETPDWEANADARLRALAPLQRVAFLLRNLEGFSVGITAEILEISGSDVEALAEAAAEEIASQLAARILIIEDEPLIALDLDRLVTSLGHEVCAVAHTRDEAVAAVAANPPELILADIHLADGSSGIDAVDHILTTIPVPTIFITAFPDLLLTGERTEPTFLIAKPYDPEAVKAMVSQVLFFGTTLPNGRAA